MGWGGSSERGLKGLPLTWQPLRQTFLALSVSPPFLSQSLDCNLQTHQRSLPCRLWPGADPCGRALAWHAPGWEGKQTLGSDPSKPSNSSLRGSEMVILSQLPRAPSNTDLGQNSGSWVLQDLRLTAYTCHLCSHLAPLRENP